MVQAIENWTDLSGTLRDVRPREGSPGMTDVLIAVEEARDVGDFPNLLTGTPGQELAVAIETEAVPRLRLRPGDAIVCRAQRASPQTVVAHPDGLSHRP